MDEPRDELHDLLASYRQAIEPPAESEARVREALRSSIPGWSTPPSPAERGVLLPFVGRARQVVVVGCALAAALALTFGVSSYLGERRELDRDLAQTPFQRSDSGAAERQVEARSPEVQAPSSDPVATPDEGARVEPAGADAADEVEVELEGASAAEALPEADVPAPRRVRATTSRAASTEPDAIEAPSPAPEAEEAAPILDLARELRLIRAAEEHLQAGRGDEALAALERHRREFPGGQLEPEREASRVTALCQQGRADEASARAQAFAERWPDSPLVARVRRVCAAD
ncbi:MAG: hypothetical protein H6711_31610 [Myxococcales bacterium]|nr:hypothetical protein [Myxococcales bacterium]